MNYGAPESWVRCEAEFEAEVESNDDPIEVSKSLHDVAKKMVIDDINVIVANIRNAAAGRATGAKPAAPAPAPAAPAPAPVQTFTPPVTSTPAPAVSTAPSATAYPANTANGTGQPQPSQGTIGLQPSANGPATIPGNPRRL